MKKFVVTVLGAAGLLGLAPAQAAPNDHANPAARVVHSAPVCPGPASAGSAHCHALVVTDANGVPIATGIARSSAKGGNGGKGGGGKGGGGGGGGGGTPPPPAGAYGPAQFQTAYSLTGSATGMTVAIVDAYDNPNVENDLAVYSKAYGLPACTSSNGCFTKLNQNGTQGSFPRADAGWALEIALDVQAVHAVCPDCYIVLVEANSSRLSDLLAAEYIASQRGNVVSNSWGASEFSSEPSYDGDFGAVPTTVSSGDSGYGAEWPAAASSAIAVGGTTLLLNGDKTRASETVWSGSGSGCSAYESKPGWQHDSGCSNRTIADVAADADPATGAAVYDSYGYQGMSGWFTVGGTSLASPIIAAIFARAGATGNAATLYSNAGALYDVKSGKNGNCGTYLCQGAVGYDGPTGVGAPNGVSAFK